MAADINILEILLNWKIVLIVIVVILVLPVIFYFASLDRTAIKVKKIKLAPRKAEVSKQDGPQPGVRKPEAEKKQSAYGREGSVQSKEEK